MPHDLSSASPAAIAAVRAALRAAIDPELRLDIGSLGLVYDVVVPDGSATVTCTVATRGCPMERGIGGGIRAAADGVPGVAAVELRLVRDPVWHAGMAAPGSW